MSRAAHDTRRTPHMLKPPMANFTYRMPLKVNSLGADFDMELLLCALTFFKQASSCACCHVVLLAFLARTFHTSRIASPPMDPPHIRLHRVVFSTLLLLKVGNDDTLCEIVPTLFTEDFAESNFMVKPIQDISPSLPCRPWTFFELPTNLPRTFHEPSTNLPGLFGRPGQAIQDVRRDEPGL